MQLSRIFVFLLLSVAPALSIGALAQPPDDGAAKIAALQKAIDEHYEQSGIQKPLVIAGRDDPHGSYWDSFTSRIVTQDGVDAAVGFDGGDLVVFSVVIRRDGSLVRTNILAARGRPRFVTLIDSLITAAAPFPSIPDGVPKSYESVTIIVKFVGSQSDPNNSFKLKPLSGSA